jgi:NAD(P)H:quinone oxidoreductase type IV
VCTLPDIPISPAVADLLLRSGSPRPSLRRSSRRCTPHRSRTTRSSSRLSSRNTTRTYPATLSSLPCGLTALASPSRSFLFGIPTRYGNFPAQFKAFWDATGQLWASGALSGKYAGLFISTGTAGGGQESTALNALSTLAHHGIIYVPLGYAHSFAQSSNLSEVHGGSPWGAGTFAGADGSRLPSPLELEIATIQGKSFYATVAKAFP